MFTFARACFLKLMLGEGWGHGSSFKTGCVLAADGSAAFQTSSKNLAVSSLGGVSHLKKVFTPVGVLKKKDMTAAEFKTMRSLSHGDKPMVKETATTFQAASGGQQSRESLWSAQTRAQASKFVGPQRTKEFCDRF